MNFHFVVACTRLRHVAQKPQLLLDKAERARDVNFTGETHAHLDHVRLRPANEQFLTRETRLKLCSIEFEGPFRISALPAGYE